MNYLAHAFLAGALPADRVGGFIGDFVKGALPAGLPPDLAEGVRLHRRIDAFADGHPAFLRSRARVSAARRRFAGVMVDMFYDHFLARHWAMLGTGTLEAFTAGVYRDVDARHDELPAALQQLLPRIREGDWLTSYRAADVIATAIDRMSRRLRRENALAGGGVELLQDYEGFEADFFEFLEAARRFSESYRRTRALLLG